MEVSGRVGTMGGGATPTQRAQARHTHTPCAQRRAHRPPVYPLCSLARRPLTVSGAAPPKAMTSLRRTGVGAAGAGAGVATAGVGVGGVIGASARTTMLRRGADERLATDFWDMRETTAAIVLEGGGVRDGEVGVGGLSGRRGVRVAECVSVKVLAAERVLWMGGAARQGLYAVRTCRLEAVERPLGGCVALRSCRRLGPPPCRVSRGPLLAVRRGVCFVWSPYPATGPAVHAHRLGPSGTL